MLCTIYCIVLYCIVLYCIVLYCIVLDMHAYVIGIHDIALSTPQIMEMGRFTFKLMVFMGLLGPRRN